MAATHHTPDPTWRLTALELTRRSGSEFFYANGRQQVALMLYVEATLDPASTPNPTLVPLTESEIASLRLFTYELESEVPWDAGATTPGWSASRRPSGYDPFPGGLETASLPRSRPRAGGQYFELFLSGLPHIDLLRPGETSKFAISLRGDNGKRYLSNNKYWDADGVLQPVGGFESHVNVIPVSPPRYGAESFRLGRIQLAELEQPGAPQGDEQLPPESEFVFVLTLHGSDGRAIGIRSLTSGPQGTVRWMLPPANPRWGCYTGFASPDEQAFHWNPNVPQGSRSPPAYPAIHHGKALLALVGRVDLTPGPSPGGCALTVMDFYGNTERITVDFIDRTTSAGRWELVVSN